MPERTTAARAPQTALDNRHQRVTLQGAPSSTLKYTCSGLRVCYNCYITHTGLPAGCLNRGLPGARYSGEESPTRGFKEGGAFVALDAQAPDYSGESRAVRGVSHTEALPTLYTYLTTVSVRKPRVTGLGLQTQ